MSEPNTISNIESYPPLFRQPKKLDDPDSESIKRIQNSDPIPIIDLQCINLDLLDEACKDWGIFRLVNHGVPTTLLNQLQDHAKILFSHPFESKQALFGAPITYFWGSPALSPSGAPVSRGSQNVNWVESFNVPICKLSHNQTEGSPMVVPFR